MNEQSPVETLREIRANFAALQAELDAARARIAELEAARRWVPVGERLPELDPEYITYSVNVMVIDDDGNMGIEYFWYGRNIWVGGDISNVTHWQPLPAGPEVSNAR